MYINKNYNTNFPDVLAITAFFIGNLETLYIYIYIYTVKPVHTVTTIKQTPVSKVLS